MVSTPLKAILLKARMKKYFYPLLSVLTGILCAAVIFVAVTVFFDQAVLVRKGTIYRGTGSRKMVALTFDDGPSPVWTPLILDELKKAGVKATFFMIGRHVERYPDIARRVAAEGHEIGNHSYSHAMMLWRPADQLEDEISRAERSIVAAAGEKPKYFRPPKAWLSKNEKEKIRDMGYSVVLWDLSSKDWVTFDDRFIIKYILDRVRPGDIILFHDSGGVFSAEGGDRSETVKTIPRLVEQLKAQGYECVTISQLLEGKKK